MLDVQVLTDSAASLNALRAIVAWADTVDLAYAWASSAGGTAPHWTTIPLEKVRRAIIGTHFAQTEPFVLRRLLAHGSLRVVADTGGVFHPKVVIGIVGSEARALLGSSNLTPGGFAGNTEANVLLTGSTSDPAVKQLLAFMDQQWTHPRSFEPGDEWLEEYEQLYESRPTPPKMRPKKRPQSIVESGDDLDLDWPAFVELISKQERRSLWTGYTIHVFDHPDGSYLQEVEACQEAFASEPSFSEMAEEDRKLVSGWGPRTAGYYGRMQGAGYFKNLTRERPEEIGEHLDKIPLHGPVTTRDAKTFLRGALGVKGVALGVATRLLCMKRPDIFLPANNASIANIKRVFETTPNTIEKYTALVERIWRFPWFSAPKPKDKTEARIWRARVALLDAIFYEPPEYLK